MAFIYGLFKVACRSTAVHLLLIAACTMQHLRYVGVVLLITLLATYNVRTAPLEEEKLTYLEELIQRAIEGEQHNSVV